MSELSCSHRSSLYANQLAGTLPPSWGQGGSFPLLRSLYLDTNFVTGSLPPEWGVDPQSWPQLRFLCVFPPPPPSAEDAQALLQHCRVVYAADRMRVQAACTGTRI